eukprot:scaffold2636_cov340-Pavlova_lutheri.AAC.158
MVAVPSRRALVSMQRQACEDEISIHRGACAATTHRRTKGNPQGSLHTLDCSCRPFGKTVASAELVAIFPPLED